jgi:UDP-glucuronate decarboxylase
VYVSSHLVDKLMDEGHVVIVLDNFFTGSLRNVQKWVGHPRFQVLEWDVILPIYMSVDQIYHLACPASPIHYQADPVFTIKTNVMGTLNMLGLATRNNARILLASTSEVYGDPLEHPQKETYRGNVNTTGIRSCYDEGKRVAETLSFDFHREKGTDIRVARIFNTFGDRMNQDDGRVVSNFIVQKLKGKKLTVYGGGRQTRSFCFVDDMVNGLYALMNTEGVTGPINIGNPVENTILELAQAVAETIDGPGAVVNVDDKPMPSDDPGRRKPDITLAKTLLGWEPKVPLREGLKKAVAYFRTVVQRP